MKKKELAKQIAANTGFSLAKPYKALKAILEAIRKSLREGENVSLRNFGAFKLSVRSPRSSGYFGQTLADFFCQVIKRIVVVSATQQFIEYLIPGHCVFVCRLALPENSFFLNPKVE